MLSVVEASLFNSMSYLSKQSSSSSMTYRQNHVRSKKIKNTKKLLRLFLF